MSYAVSEGELDLEKKYIHEKKQSNLAYTGEKKTIRTSQCAGVLGSNEGLKGAQRNAEHSIQIAIRISSAKQFATNSLISHLLALS